MISGGCAELGVLGEDACDDSSPDTDEAGALLSVPPLHPERKGIPIMLTHTLINAAARLAIPLFFIRYHPPQIHTLFYCILADIGRKPAT